MKKILSLFCTVMMTVLVFGQSYGILVNGHTYFAGESAGEFEGFTQYLSHVQLQSGDYCQLYDAENKAAWAVSINPASAEGFVLNNDRYEVTVDGCYDFYIKLKYGQDELYIGNGSNCGEGEEIAGEGDGSVEIRFSEVVSNNDLAEDATFSVAGSTFAAQVTDPDNKMQIDANPCRFGTADAYVSYSHRLKTGGKSSATKNFITLTIPEDGTLNIAVRTGSNSATDRSLVVKQGETELFNQVILESSAIKVMEGETEVSVYPYITVPVKAGSVLLNYPVNGINFYAFAFKAGETPEPIVPVDSMTVYFVNNLAWENVNAFVWPAEGDAYKAWPGEAMTKEAEQINGFDVYSYTFPASYVNIIFNNGNSGEGNQTADLVWEAAKPYFYGGVWYAKADIPTGGDPQEEEFVGFDARTVNLGEQIAAGLAKNLVNVTFVETTEGKYSVNLVEGGVEGSFSFGGVIFAYTNSNAGTTAYKTFGTYIQPNGKDREVRIPLNAGEKANVILTEACEGVLVNGVSTNLASGDNILTAVEGGLVLKTASTKPKIQAILPVVVPVESTTVYYVNNLAWENVNAFVWPAEGDAYKAWPGEAMTKEAEQINGFDVYSYTFPASYVNIIFNNGNSGEGNQTADLVWEAAKPYFYDGAWYASLEAIPAPEAPAKFYVTGDSALIADAAPAGTAAWAPNAIKSEKDTLVLNLKADVDYQLSLTVDGTWNTKKTYANLTQEDKSGLYDVDGENHNIGFKLKEAGEVKVVYFVKDEVVTFELIGNFNVAPVDPEAAKFYITGDAALLGEELAWNPAAIKVTEDSYTFENLAVGDYKLKVTLDGTWGDGMVKGFSDLTTVADGLTADNDGNICFTLAEAGNVSVHYDGEYFFLNGNFYVVPVVSADYYMKNGWDGGEWTWKAMTLNEGTYFLENVVVSGDGVNLNNAATDEGASWITWAEIETYDMSYEAATISALDTVVFMFDPEAVNQYTGAKGLSAIILGKYVAPVDPEAAKFYITGDAALLGEELAWNPAAIKVTEDSYTFENLAVGDYKLKVTLDGTWGDGMVKGFSDLTTVADGLTADNDGNICFTLAEAGNVSVHYDGEYFFLNGNFYVVPVVSADYYMKNGWDGGEWTWKAMTLNEGTYFLENVVVGGDGVNLNNAATDEGASWITWAEIETYDTSYEAATISALDTVVFMFDPEAVNQYTGANGLSAIILGKYVAPVDPQQYEYGLLVDGTFVPATKNTEYVGEGEEWVVTTNLVAGNKFQNYENTTSAGWLVPLDPNEGNYTNFDIEDNFYVVKESGNYTFYIKLIFENDNMWVVKNGATAISNTAADAEAVKVLHNGMLLIRKGNKTYTIMGQAVK